LAARLLIITHVERVPALDNGKTLGFGLTMSAAWDLKNPPEAGWNRDLLLPWRWPRIRAVSVYWQGAANTDQPSSPVDVIEQNIEGAGDALKGAVEAQYASVASSLDNIVWPIGAGTMPDGVPIRVSAGGLRPWNAFLMDLATGPGRLSRSLNLAFTFRCEPPPGPAGLQLVAAPVLESDTLFGGRRAPAGAPESGADVGGRVLWQYSAGTPDLGACTASCPLDIPQAAMVDLKTQWVSAGDGNNPVSFEDWEPMLTRRIVEGFRQDRFIRDYLQNGDLASLKPDQLWLLRDRFLAAVRDAAGTGLRKGIHGVSAAEVFLSRNSPPITLSHDQWGSLVTALETSLTLDAWVSVLKDALPELSGLAIFWLPDSAHANQPPLLTVTQLASEAARLLDALGDTRADPGHTSALWRLFKAQWQPVLKNPPALIDRKTADDIEARFRAQSADDNAGAELEALLADELLARYWTTFVRSNKAPKDPLGTQLLDASYPWFALYHARTRWGTAPGAPSTCLTVAKANVDLPAQPVAFLPPIDSQLDETTVSSLERFFCDWIKKSLARLRPVAAQVTHAPAPMTFQLGRLEGENGLNNGQTTGDDARDTARQFAGFGVLMRERRESMTPAQAAEIPPDWWCLNMAAVHRGAGDSVFPGPVLVPYRPHYQAGLRRATVSYNNQSLVADTPLTDSVMAGVQLEDRRKNRTDVADLLRYRYTTDARLPGLKFGHSYEMAAFTISNSGVLPREIRVPTAPHLLRQPSDADVKGLRNKGIIGPPIWYRRTVPVGELRLCGTGTRSDGGDEPLRLPPIPDDVAPLAVDMLDTLMPETKGGDANTPRPPLVLLSPSEWEVAGSRGMSSADFAVRLPQVTWSCYDRWVAATGSANRTQRAAVIAKVHELHANALARAKAAGNGALHTQAPDTSLDDPAVSRKVYVELLIERNGKLVPPELPNEQRRGFIEVAPPRLTDPIGRLTADKAKVTCKLMAAPEANASAAPQPQMPFLEFAPSLVTVNVPRGVVCSLKLSACVSVQGSGGEGETRMFDDILKPAGSSWPKVASPDTPGDKVYLMSSISVLIEGATPDMPSAPELFAASATRLDVTMDGPPPAQLDRLPGRHVIRLEMPRSDAAPLASFRFLQRADVHRQMWGWAGRPVATHPHLLPASGNAPPAEDAMRNWVADEFGERADNDHSTSPCTTVPLVEGTTNAPSHRGFRRFVYEQVLATDKDTTRIQGAGASYDLRGHHLRYGVRAYSRYGSLMPEALRSRDAARPVVQGQPATDRWQNIFVPCRRRPPFAPPRVKLILPLTEGFGESVMGTPGLLVVLSEPWYEVAGLGESLSVQVGEVTSPWDSNNEKGRTYLEFGPDPILQPLDQPPFAQPIRPGTLRQERIGDSDEWSNSRAPVVGPVGHYFDRDNNVALFVASSFIIPVPHIQKTDTENRAWYFARLRFARKVVTREPQASGPYTPDDAAWPRVVYHSEPSSDFWVQYLPEFSIYSGWQGQVSSLTPEFESTGKMSLYDTAHHVVTLQPTPSKKKIFKLFAVVTKRIVDATGRAGEVYVGVLAQSTDPATWTPTSGDISGVTANVTKLRVRLIEVQVGDAGVGTACQAPQPGNGNFWGWLFPDKPDCDAPARIVRVSRPLPPDSVSDRSTS
jgi:hypothetical protein